MHRRRLAWIAGICSLFTACTTLGSSETVGEQFRKALAQIDAQCKKDKLGPYLDPEDPEYLMKRNRTDCDILALKPYDPLATPEGRFAHSLKLPPPHDKPKDVYKPGMTAEEYFKALCETEAGEWVFRRVEGVRGFMVIRQWPSEPRTSLLAQYYAKDETLAVDDFVVGPNAEAYVVSPTIGAYEFMERPIYDDSDAKRYVQFFRDARQPMQREPYGVGHRVITHPLSQYGYTWRGVRIPHGEELGIFGAETIVLDLQTHEILGFRRVFRRIYFDKADVGTMWPTQTCPSAVDLRKNAGVAFVERVLMPSEHRTTHR